MNELYLQRTWINLKNIMSHSHTQKNEQKNEYYMISSYIKSQNRQQTTTCNYKAKQIQMITIKAEITKNSGQDERRQ